MTAASGPDRKRVALFGGGGFVGSNLAARLAVNNAYQPRVYDTDARKLALATEEADAIFVNCDITTDAAQVEAAVAEADVVVSLAAYVQPKRFLQRPLDVIDLNFTAAIGIVDACRRHNKRLIHFSTSEVYGKTGGRDAPFREDETDCILGPVANHRWIYSCAKQLLDRIIHAHGLNGDLDYTLIRPFNFVGPLMDWLGASDDQPRVFASFLTALEAGAPLPLVDGGRSLRCFTSIDDAVAAIVAILNHPEAAKNQIFNVGNPANETTIAEFAARLTRIYGEAVGRNVPLRTESVASAAFYGPGYEDCDRRLPDITKIMGLGWAPQDDLDAALRKGVRFALDHRAALEALAPLNAATTVRAAQA